MDPPDDFDDIRPMKPEEQYEMLLRIVSAAVEIHSSADLLVLRAHLLRSLPDGTAPDASIRRMRPCFWLPVRDMLA